MFLAPPLPSGEKRGSRLTRLLSGLGLGTAALVLLIVNLVLSLAVYYAVDPHASPRQLYHNTWQAVRDNYYNQDQLQDWDKWEHKYDGQIRTEEDALKYASEMVDSLGDRYTRLLPAQRVQEDKQRADGQFIGVGITFAPERMEPDNGKPDSGYPVIGRVFRGSPAEKGGLAPGDALTKVNGATTNSLSLEAVSTLLRGQSGTPVTITVSRAGQELTLTVTRGPVSIPIVTTARLPGDNGKTVGYIRLEAFDQWDTADEVEEALRDLSDCDSFVLDLRDNPGGFIHSALEVVALFMERGEITTERMRVAGYGVVSITYGLAPGRLTFTVAAGPFSGVRVKVPGRRPNLAGDRPLVVLVNENTASAAELVTAALKDNKRATVLGTRTFGKGIGQVYVPVGNGHRLRVTNLRGFTPAGDFIGDGGNTTAIGIAPDVELESDEEEFDFGGEDDNQLEKAVELLTRKP